MKKQTIDEQIKKLNGNGVYVDFSCHRNGMVCMYASYEWEGNTCEKCGRKLGAVTLLSKFYNTLEEAVAAVETWYANEVCRHETAD